MCVSAGEGLPDPSVALYVFQPLATFEGAGDVFTKRHFVLLSEASCRLTPDQAEEGPKGPGSRGPVTEMLPQSS